MNRRLAGALVAALLFAAFLAPSEALNEVAIHEIQFSTDPSGSSRYVGQVVTTGGVVMAVLADGYVIQELLSAPWSGIFVADGNNRPSRGDFVVLTAMVSEQGGMSRLVDLTSFNKINTHNPLPAPITIQTADIGPGAPTAESLEGVLVKLGKVSVESSAGPNRWQIRDSSGVSAYMGNRAGYGFSVQPGIDLAALQGILFAVDGVMVVEPRDDGDITPISPRPSVTGIVNLERRDSAVGVIVQLSGLPTAVTKSDGSYSIESVPPGTYTVQAYAPGYLVAERQGVQILPGHTISLPPLTLVGGDGNGDGRIDLLDLTLVARNYGLCPPPDGWADITQDGCVNLTDLVLVAQNYGRTGPTPW